MDEKELKQIHTAIRDLVEKSDYQNAISLINTVLQEDPNDSLSLYLMGSIFLNMEKPALAYQYYRRALQEAPENQHCWSYLGVVCHSLNRLDEAYNYCLKAIELDPHDIESYHHAAGVALQNSEWEVAEKLCQTASKIDPHHIKIQYYFAQIYLAQGKWKEGWKAWGGSLGHHKKRKELSYRDETRWKGQTDKDIVIYGEQGLGDEILYASCIPDAIHCSRSVIIDCSKQLEGLFKRSFPQAKVFGTKSDDHVHWLTDDVNIDHRCAIGGLPELFRLNKKQFNGRPYLTADPERRFMWRALFDSYGKKVVGITTHGGAKTTNEQGRKLTKEDLTSLLNRDDLVLVSLDYKIDEKIEGVKYFPAHTQSQDYDDVAALIAELDVVFGVNTAAQHCAAALGTKAICLVPKLHQWRYAQSDMPWYKNMTLHHQKNKTWREVIESINI